MRVEQGYPNKTRIIRENAAGKGRAGLIIEVNFQTGTWIVHWDGDETPERGVNPGECIYEPKTPAT